MSLGNYVYTSDAGVDYQITVPVDFAVALSMVAASTQPYLDASISPRFATARSATGLLRSVIVKSVGQFSTLLGTSVTVGGVSYTFTGGFGESIPASQSPLLFSPQGPQGPAGNNADVLTVTGTLSSAQLKAIHTSPVTIVPAPGASLCLDAIRIAGMYKFGTVAYGGANALQLSIGGFGVNFVPAAQMNGSSNAFAAGGAGISGTNSDLRNQPYVLTAAADYTSGDGTLEYSFDYRVVDYS